MPGSRECQDRQFVAADGYGMRYNLPTIFDNIIYDQRLIYHQRLPAMAAVMISNGGPGRSLDSNGATQRKVINNSLSQALEYPWLDYAERQLKIYESTSDTAAGPNIDL